MKTQVIKITELDNSVIITFGTKTEVKDIFGTKVTTVEYGRLKRKDTELVEGAEVDFKDIPHHLDSREFTNGTSGEKFTTNWIILN